MIDNLIKILQIKFGISEMVTIYSLAALVYGLIYRYGYFSALDIPWYIYSLSFNYIIMSTIGVFIACLMGIGTGLFCLERPKLKICILFFSFLFFISIFLEAFSSFLYDAFDIDFDLLDEILVEIIVTYPEITPLFIIGFIGVIFGTKIIENKKNLPIVLGGLVVYVFSCGWVAAVNDWEFPKYNLNEVSIVNKDLDTTKKYYLLDRNSQSVLVMEKDIQSGYQFLANTDRKYFLLKAEEVKEIRQNTLDISSIENF